MVKPPAKDKVEIQADQSVIDDELARVQAQVEQGPIGDASSRLSNVFRLVNDLAIHDTKRLKSHAAQKRVWEAFCVANDRYRKQLKRLETKKRLVEARKLRRAYLALLISSQKFFVEHVCILITKPAINATVRRRILEDRHFRGRVEIGQCGGENKENAFFTRSCYDAFVHLGDLSRYREQARGTDIRFEHALEWLTLAVDILPSEGTGYYQRAMVYVVADDLKYQLYTVFNLYRAATVEKSIKGAINSLRRVLTKLGWEKTEPVEHETNTRHLLLRYEDSNWTELALKGSLLEVPFIKGGFLLDSSGVHRITNSQESD